LLPRVTPVVSHSLPLLSTTSPAPASSTHRAREATFLRLSPQNTLSGRVTLAGANTNCPCTATAAKHSPELDPQGGGWSCVQEGVEMLLLAIIVSGGGGARWNTAPPAVVANGRCHRRHDYFSLYPH